MLPSVNLKITSKLLGGLDMKICPSGCEKSCKNTTCNIELRKAAIFLNTKLKLTLVKITLVRI